jgi:hypothetical protein
MEETRHDATHLSRRGILAATAGLSVGAVAAAGTAAASPAGSGQGVSPMSAVVNSFLQFGTIYLNPGQTQDWWFTWIFDGNHWSRMSALPMADSPAGSSVQIVTEWANANTLWVRFTNNSAVGVLFRPTVFVAP